MGDNGVELDELMGAVDATEHRPLKTSTTEIMERNGRTQKGTPLDGIVKRIVSRFESKSGYEVQIFYQKRFVAGQSIKVVSRIWNL